MVALKTCSNNHAKIKTAPGNTHGLATKGTLWHLRSGDVPYNSLCLMLALCIFPLEVRGNASIWHLRSGDVPYNSLCLMLALCIFPLEVRGNASIWHLRSGDVPYNSLCLMLALCIFPLEVRGNASRRTKRLGRFSGEST